MLTETLTAIAIFIIAIIFLNPGHLAMPDSIISLLILGLIVAFLTFAGLVLKEKSADERESLHILKAGRLSYITGVGVLVVAIVFQALEHEVDPWLVIALCTMTLSKIVSRIYSRFKL